MSKAKRTNTGMTNTYRMSGVKARGRRSYWSPSCVHGRIIV